MVPKELLAELKMVGFFGLDIPKVYGGLGLSLPQYLKIVEEVDNKAAFAAWTNHMQTLGQDARKYEIADLPNRLWLHSPL